MSAPLTPDEDTSLDMARSFPAPAYTLPDLTTSLPPAPSRPPRKAPPRPPGSPPGRPPGSSAA